MLISFTSTKNVTSKTGFMTLAAEWAEYKFFLLNIYLSVRYYSRWTPPFVTYKTPPIQLYDLMYGNIKQGSKIFPNIWRRPPSSCAPEGWLTWSKFHTGDRKILGTTLQNLVDNTTRRPRFLYRWFKFSSIPFHWETSFEIYPHGNSDTGVPKGGTT
jgi:hypothetical protein